VAAFSEAGDQRLLGIALDSAGWARDEAGDKRAALEWYERALVARRAAKDRSGEAFTLQGIGLVQLYFGEYDKALATNEEVLTLARETKDLSREAGTLHNIGGIYWSTDEMQKALEFYERALALELKLNDQSSMASTYNNIGDTYRRIGDNEKARGYFMKSLEIRRALKNRRGEAHSLHTLGLTELDENQAKKALEHFTQALEMRRATGDKRGEAYSLGGSAGAWLQLGDPEKALKFQMEALEKWKTLGERRAEAETRQNVGDTLEAAGKLDEAAQYYNEAVPVAEELRDRTTEANAFLGLAKVRRKQQRLDEAQQQIERAIAVVDDLRGRLANLELRTVYFSSVKKFYDFYIDLLMQRHQAEPNAGFAIRALQASEAARARTLLDTLAAGGVDLHRNTTAAAGQHQRELLRQLQLKQKQMTQFIQTKASLEDVSRLNTEIERLSAEHDAAIAEIRKTDPSYEALVVARPSTPEEIRAALDPGTALLEYHLGDEASYVWIATPDAIDVKLLPKRSEIEPDALRLHRAVEARNVTVARESAEARTKRIDAADREVATLSARLGKVLLPAAALSQSRRLVISADGALQYVPFRVLRRAPGAKMLIESHELVSIPGASVLVALRNRAGRGEAPKAIAVFADPVFDASDPRVNPAVSPAAAREQSRLRSATNANLASLPRLRFSREEATAIAAQAPGRVLEALDFQATKDIVASSNIRKYGTLHFATHGILDSKRPELSGLVLSLVDSKGKPRDGFLRLRQIYALDLKADLVVLSACQTALGKEVRGEGLIGLTRGFMYAGAPRVIASLWRVDDRATAKLMSSFYREMGKGVPPARALRAAQLALAADPRWKEPYYWSSFQLQGDWR
jgi:CHAT domain-containing protein